jgi:hypothetical protein
VAGAFPKQASLVRVLANGTAKTIAAAFGWSVAYTRAVLRVWKSRAAYCTVVLAGLRRRQAASSCNRSTMEGQEAMAKRPAPPTATEEEVRALLERYRCPVPFHEVRTRFLGNVATPLMSASPIKMVEGLWGGKLPDFSSIDEANELIGALIMGSRCGCHA